MRAKMKAKVRASCYMETRGGVVKDDAGVTDGLTLNVIADCDEVLKGAELKGTELKGAVEAQIHVYDGIVVAEENRVPLLIRNCAGSSFKVHRGDIIGR